MVSNPDNDRPDLAGETDDLRAELKSTDDELWGIEPGPGVGEFKVWDRMP